MEIRFIKTPKGEKQYCCKCNQEVKALKQSNKYKGYSHISVCCEAKTYFAVKQAILKAEATN